MARVRLRLRPRLRLGLRVRVRVCRLYVSCAPLAGKLPGCLRAELVLDFLRHRHLRQGWGEAETAAAAAREVAVRAAAASAVAGHVAGAWWSWRRWRAVDGGKRCAAESVRVARAAVASAVAQRMPAASAAVARVVAGCVVRAVDGARSPPCHCASARRSSRSCTSTRCTPRCARSGAGG